MTVRALKKYFHHYLIQIEAALDKAVLDMGEATPLRDACAYSLKSGGKRLRPLFVHLVAESLKSNVAVSDAAVCVELFHTASLIIDDLPCMDNDDKRRGVLTCHKVYGESTALLASYALITAAFEKISHAASKMKQEGEPEADLRGMRALQEVSVCAGVLGATTGQFYDLFPPDHSLQNLLKVAYQKTGTLFEIAFVLGWIFGGGDLALLDRVKKSASHLGIAFQILDDLADLSSDQKQVMNFATCLGKEEAKALFQDEMHKAKESLIELNLYTPSMKKMCDLLYEQ
ncbi:MAG: polyprenyl synthetase family protein [Candidatus Rhabdochlamydia sp.]